MFESFLDTYNLFAEHGFDDPLGETLRLFDLASGGALRRIDLSGLGPGGGDPASIVSQRKEGVPMEYILGRAVFFGHSLLCTPDTLIPREETELLVRVAIGFIEEKLRGKLAITVIDVGTGCGNIAVALAASSPAVRVLASDISPSAIEVARENVAASGLADRVSLACGDLLAPFQLEQVGSVDLIVCNPPYIPTNSLSKLASEVIDHEPHVALDGGSYGIDIFQRLIHDAPELLAPGGVLAFEIGAGQERLVTKLLQRTPDYQDIQYHDDGEHVRVISAVKRA